MKLLTLTGLVVCGCTMLCFSQEKQDERSGEHKHFIYGSPLGIVTSTFNVTYERQLSNSNSIAIMGGATLSNTFDIDKKGGNGEIQYRVNLSKKLDRISKNNFFYFAPYLLQKYIQITTKDYNYYYNDNNYGKKTTNTIVSYSGGMLLGIRLTNSSNRLAFNAFAGGGMKYSEISGTDSGRNYNNGIWDIGFTGVVPRVGFQVGISF